MCPLPHKTLEDGCVFLRNGIFEKSLHLKIHPVMQGIFESVPSHAKSFAVDMEKSNMVDGRNPGLPLRLVVSPTCRVFQIS